MPLHTNLITYINFQHLDNILPTHEPTINNLAENAQIYDDPKYIKYCVGVKCVDRVLDYSLETQAAWHCGT